MKKINKICKHFLRRTKLLCSLMSSYTNIWPQNATNDQSESRMTDSIFHSKLQSFTWCKNRLLVRLWPSWSVRVGSGLWGRRSPRVSGSPGTPPQRSYSSDLLSYTANRKWHHNRELYCRGSLVTKNQWYEIFQKYTSFTVYDGIIIFKLDWVLTTFSTDRERKCCSRLT